MFSFEPSFISAMAPKFIELIKECDDEYFPKYLLFRNLGMCLVFDESSSSSAGKATHKENNKHDLQLLNEVWRIVTKFPEPAVKFYNKILFFFF